MKKSESPQNVMVTKPVFSLLLSMSLPVMLSMLIQSLYNIVDSFWVAKLGTDALTAVSLAFPLQNIILSVGVGMGIGMSARISICLGQGSREQASRAASMGTMLVVLHCLVFLLGDRIFTEPFLGLFTDNRDILSQACDYTHIVVSLSFGILMQIGLEKIFQGAGKMLTTMFLMATGAVINLILDPILIFGLWSLPALGIRGAALATVIGQITAMALYILVYRFTDLGLDISLKYAKFDGKLAKNLYSIAIPSGLMLALPSALTGILNAILVGFGEVYVAVLGLYFKLQTFVNMPANGIIQGMRPIIGYNYGAGDHGRVRKTIHCSLLLVTLISLAGTLAALIFPRAILELFDAEPQLLEGGILALRIIGPGFLISSAAVVVCGVLEALGEGRASLHISMLRQLVLIVPIAWGLSLLWGPAGVWLAFPIAELATLGVAVKKLIHLNRHQLA